MLNTIKQQEIPVDYENCSKTMQEAIKERIPDYLKDQIEIEQDSILNEEDKTILVNNLGFDMSTIDESNNILTQSLKCLVNMWKVSEQKRIMDKHQLECAVADKANEILGNQKKYDYEHKSQEILDNYLTVQPKDYVISAVNLEKVKYTIKLHTNSEQELNNLYTTICNAGYCTTLMYDTQIFKLTENEQYYLMILFKNISDIELFLCIMNEDCHYSGKELIDLFKTSFSDNVECSALLNKYYLNPKDLFCYKGEQIYQNLPEYNNNYISTEIEKSKAVNNLSDSVIECIVTKYKQANELLSKNKKELAAELKRRKEYVEEKGIEQLLKNGGLRTNFVYDENTVEIIENIPALNEFYENIIIERRLPIEFWQMCLIEPYV